jgi:hypothetical protein
VGGDGFWEVKLGRRTLRYSTSRRPAEAWWRRRRNARWARFHSCSSSPSSSARSVVEMSTEVTLFRRVILPRAERRRRADHPESFSTLLPLGASGRR